MVEFDYTAMTEAGEHVRGRIAATNEDAARAALVARGLTCEHIELAADQSLPPRTARLSEREAEDLAQVLSEVCSDDVSVADGFRAAASEVSSGRLAQTFVLIAQQLDAGRSLTDALDERALPAHVKGLIVSARRTGQLGFALTDLIEGRRVTRDLKRHVVLDLTYPTIVMCLAVLVFTFMGLYIVPIFREMFIEFDLNLPAITICVLWVSRYVVWSFFVIAPPLCVVIVLLRVMAGDAFWSRVIQLIPVLGSIWRWSAVAEFSRTCGVLMRYNVPLPEAMRLTGESVGDARMRSVGHQLAHALESGEPFADSIKRRRNIPASFVPFITWGESANALGESFESLADMFEERVRLRSALLRSLLPPLIFVFVLLVVGLGALALILPMVNLISALAW